MCVYMCTWESVAQRSGSRGSRRDARFLSSQKLVTSVRHVRFSLNKAVQDLKICFKTTGLA